jgi:hypothetical protein
MLITSGEFANLKSQFGISSFKVTICDLVLAFEIAWSDTASHLQCIRMTS